MVTAFVLTNRWTNATIWTHKASQRSKPNETYK